MCNLNTLFQALYTYHMQTVLFIQDYLHASHLVLRPLLPLLVHYQVLYHSALQCTVHVHVYCNVR